MEKEEFITERTRIISEMLDNPDKYEIYPTSKCFEEFDNLFDRITGKELTASEALFGFASWLTTRKGTLMIGSKYNAVPICDLVADYIAANKLTGPTKAYPDNLVTPEER